MAQKVGTKHGVLDNAKTNRPKSPQIKDMIGANHVSETSSRITFKEILVDEITPRPINKYVQSRIDHLATSIHHTGNSLINPIVIAKASELPEDSEVIVEFKSNGIDISNLKYVIVDGERRFHAWSKLREERKNKLKGRQGEINPFDKITARVLTAVEAKKEKIFHEEANLYARKLSNTEIVLNVKDAIDSIKTDEDKRAALVKMNEGKETYINEDPKIAAKKYRAERYCQYYLESELGITDIGESTIRKKLSIIHGCIPEVVEDHVKGIISERNALKVGKVNKDLQTEIYAKYKSASEKFVKEVDKILEEKENVKENKQSVEDQKKKIVAIGKILAKYKEDLTTLKDYWLGKIYVEKAEGYIRALEEFEKVTNEYIDELSK